MLWINSKKIAGIEVLRRQASVSFLVLTLFGVLSFGMLLHSVDARIGIGSHMPHNPIWPVLLMHGHGKPCSSCH